MSAHTPTPVAGNRSCPVCGASQRSLVVAVPIAHSDFTKATSIEVVSCDRCGMCFSSDDTGQVELDARYEEKSKYAVLVSPPASFPQAASPQGTREEPEWDVARVKDTAEYLSTRVPTGAPLLDAGCATGALLAALQGKGFSNLFGIDPSPGAIETAARTTNARVYAGSIAFPPRDLPPIETITLAHVLEHLHDVRGALRAAHTALAEGGFMYVEVPDASRYHEAVVAPFQDFNTEHINHFSPDLLDRVIAEAGFERIDLVQHTIRCSPIDPYPVVFGLWRRLSSPSTNGTRPHEADRHLREALVLYSDVSARRMQRMDHLLRGILSKGQPVVIWGSGELSLKLLRNTILADCDVRAIVDGSSAKHGRNIGGHVVTDPSTLMDSEIPIVVASIGHGAAIAAYARRRFGETRRVVVLFPEQSRVV